MIVAAAPVRRDTAAGRFYDIDGATYPSVTHVLACLGKPALIAWAANQERSLVLETAADLYRELTMTPPLARPVYLQTLQGRLGKQRAHQRALDKAGSIGTQVHQLIEWNLRKGLGQTVGPEPRVGPEAAQAYAAFLAWAISVDLKPKLIEQTVWSHTHQYAGTMDLLAEVEGVLTLVDFKTGKAIYGEAYLQNVAYQVALAEMGHPTPEAGLIVRLPKTTADPGFELGVAPPVAELFPVFQAVRTVWTWHHAQEVAYQAARGGG